MRWSILRTLLHKEILRHLANRGGIALALLLVVAAMLLSFFGKDDVSASGLTGGVQYCFVDYWEDDPWVDHLRRHVPPELQKQIQFRSAATVPTARGVLVYPPGSAAIQIRVRPASENGPRYKVWFWYSGQDSKALAVYEAWFWKESHHFLYTHNASAQERLGEGKFIGVEEVEEERSQLDGGWEPRSAMATALVLFALFFVCVYLLPSLTCEERERGILLAQALSPASTTELLAAKFLFYPIVALALAVLLAAFYRPSVLTQAFFWLALIVAVMGSLGIGLTISSLACSQRSASMGALCYTLAVSMILFICQQNNIWGISILALEYHCPRMLHAALTNTVHAYHWGNLAIAAVLAIAWTGAAAFVFQRRGWQ